MISDHLSEKEIAQNEQRKRIEIRRELCETSHLYFTRYFFKVRQGMSMIVNWHHHFIAEELDKVLAGETENLLINVPPGSSKTEMAVISFMARGLALNPHAKFLHISSGDDLVLLNSQTAREIVTSDEFQQMWRRKIGSDDSAKKRWNVMVQEDGRVQKGGGVYAVALGGQITGFRAGRMAPGFQGAIVIDDALKADDAFSLPKVKVANRRLITTVKSRKANPATPVVVVMQRVGDNDPAGFIIGGNVPGKWKCVVIPALIDDAYVATLPEHIQKLLRESTKDSPRDDKGRFSYWQYKEPLHELLEMEAGIGQDADGNRVSRFVFASQYQQAPKILGGDIIHDKFPRAGVLPKIKYRVIFGDTAQKTAERNDRSCFECWGLGEDGKIYLIDLLKGKWEAPELKKRAREFWIKHCSPSLYPPLLYGKVREMKIEDKSSGTGLIQDIKRGELVDGVSYPPIPVKAIERSKDKLTRVMDVVSYIDAGLVCLLDGQDWISDFVAECEAFTADDTHTYDDQIDPMCDAISDMLGPKKMSFFS